MNFFAKIIRHTNLLGHQIDIFIASDDVIAGVLIMHFGGPSKQTDRNHVGIFGIIVKLLDL